MFAAASRFFYSCSTRLSSHLFDLTTGRSTAANRRGLLAARRLRTTPGHSGRTHGLPPVGDRCAGGGGGRHAPAKPWTGPRPPNSSPARPVPPRAGQDPGVAFQAFDPRVAGFGDPDLEAVDAGLAPMSLARHLEGHPDGGIGAGRPGTRRPARDPPVDRLDAVQARSASGRTASVHRVHRVDRSADGGGQLGARARRPGGGTDVLGKAGEHSGGLTIEQLAAADPDVIAIMPCGFDIERSCREMTPLVSHPLWPRLSAVENRRVVMTDRNQYFNRPGPRVVESVTAGVAGTTGRAMREAEREGRVGLCPGCRHVRVVRERTNQDYYWCDVPRPTRAYSK